MTLKLPSPHRSLCLNNRIFLDSEISQANFNSGEFQGW